MYAESLHIYGFKCFGKAVLHLRHPGETAGETRLNNVNLVLGDNGKGKSSVLRAAAIAILAPALLESGFVPYRLVRRPDAEQSFLKVIGRPQRADRIGNEMLPETLELIARIERRSKGSLDRLSTKKTPDSPIDDLIFDDESAAFFVVGYGATRRVETGDYSESMQRRSRGLRYRRIAGLFEDHVPLRPLQSWIPKAEGRMDEIEEIFSMVLPEVIRFTGKRDKDDDNNDYVFSFEGSKVPFTALSDGYKAFIGWVSDLLGHLHDVCPSELSLREVGGVVLIDEIDLHLHPEWQRQVVQRVATTFPQLQFIMTTHSPLVASSVQKENIFLTMEGDDGHATISQIEETVYGRSVEQLLLSSYFGLENTKPKDFTEASQVLFESVAKGDTDAALAFLEQISELPSGLSEMNESFADAKRAAARRKRE